MTKRLLLILGILLLWVGQGWAAVNDFTADGGEWNTAGNWSLGHVPTNAEDVTVTGIVSAGKTLTITTTNASAKSIDFSTAGAAFTLSGAVTIYCYGDLKLKTGMTWSHTGALMAAYHTNTTVGTLTSNSVDLSSINKLYVRGGSLELGDDLYLGTKGITVQFDSYAAKFKTNNHTVTSAAIGDSNGAGAVTLDLGTSTLNLGTVGSNSGSIRFQAATLTQTSTTHTLNIVTEIQLDSYWGNVAWGTVNISLVTLVPYVHTFTMGGSNVSFVQLNISQNAVSTRDIAVTFDNNFAIGDSSTWRGGGAAGTDPTMRLIAQSSVPGTPRTITVSAASKTLTFTDVNFQDITIANTNSPTITGARIGDMGGNTNVDADAPKTVYAGAINSSSLHWYNAIWSATAEATYAARAAAVNINNFPLPQDTAIIDDLTFSGSGRTLPVDVPCLPNITATSALSNAETLSFNTITVSYGSLLLTGTNLALTSTSGKTLTFDARVATTSSINLGSSIGAIGLVVDSNGGTVRLLTNNLTNTGNFTLNRGTFDLNGLTLTTTKFISSGSNTRTFTDGSTGGKLILLGTNDTTNAIFDTTTATNYAVSGAPSIQIGDSTKTLTTNVTFMGAGKTYGNFTVKKHADTNYVVISPTGGSCTFATVTHETPTADIGGIKFPQGITTNLTSLVADGAATHKITLTSSDGAHAATLSDTTGTNKVTNCTITWLPVTGGATWTALTADGNTVDANSTGWTTLSGGGGGLSPGLGLSGGNRRPNWDKQ